MHGGKEGVAGCLYGGVLSFMANRACGDGAMDL